jgi:hypothetical protein
MKPEKAEAPAGDSPKPEAKAEAKAENKDEMDPEEVAKAMMGKGMMGGMMGGRGGRGPAGPPPVKYDPTVWGRYAKILLSSSEFLFIN